MLCNNTRDYITEEIVQTKSVMQKEYYIIGGNEFETITLCNVIILAPMVILSLRPEKIKLICHHLCLDGSVGKTLTARSAAENLEPQNKSRVNQTCNPCHNFREIYGGLFWVDKHQPATTSGFL